MENIKSMQEKEAEKIKVQNERLKANLLRGISHDLRTPITSISGNASVLMQSGDSLAFAAILRTGARAVSTVVLRTVIFML